MGAESIHVSCFPRLDAAASRDRTQDLRLQGVVKYDLVLDKALMHWDSSGKTLLPHSVFCYCLAVIRAGTNDSRRQRDKQYFDGIWAEHLGEVFRLDAKAEGDKVVIGGWRCAGASSTKEAAWFAVKLDSRNAPWAFSPGEPFRTIASLELLVVLVGLMVLVPEADSQGRNQTLSLIHI